MTDPVRYLGSLAQALARMSLYGAGHPARARAADRSLELLRELQTDDPRPAFSFLGREVIYNRTPLRELGDWDWAERLSRCGVQRMEFDRQVDREEYHAFLEDVLARMSLNASGQPVVVRDQVSAPISFGSVGLRESDRTTGTDQASLQDTIRRVTDLTEEADAVAWLHDEVGSDRAVAFAEAETVVASLGAVMHGDRHLMVPLLTLKDFDQYTTTHAMNVSVLAMGLAEYIGLSPREIRLYGMAGLLHDLGKVRVPVDVLRKPGTLTDDERRVLQHHPVDGARIILSGSRRHDLCATVAFEHHIMIDGGGYPDNRSRRDCHHASLLVHVCDVFDALRTHRPYRVAWAVPDILSYIEARIGMEFDADVANAFLAMIREWEVSEAVAASLEPDDATVPVAL
jgi:HD-GYP domain-containing protein (c-di-GMP phosphodiesterase class II)